MRHMFKISAALAALALSTSPAQARRTVVDQDGSVPLAGYCDLNGDDCTPTSLGFTIDLGGTKYNSFVLYGNGAITFGNTAVDNATILGASTLASYGVPVISAGIDNSEDIYFGGGFLQSGKTYQLSGANGFGATFEIWLGSSSYKVESTLEVEAIATGLNVTISNYANYDEGYPFGVSPSTPFTYVVPQLAGYSAPGVGIEEYLISDATNGTGASPLKFFIPGTVTFDGGAGAVPEPATWAMMIVGFGAVGAAVRRRRAVRGTVPAG